MFCSIVSPPYNKIKIGDEIYLKETGKEITAKALVGKVQFFELNSEIVEDIRIKYGKQIGTDKSIDWESTKLKKYGTLIWLQNVQIISAISVPRSNGAGWILWEMEE